MTANFFDFDIFRDEEKQRDGANIQDARESKKRHTYGVKIYS